MRFYDTALLTISHRIDADNHIRVSRGQSGNPPTIDWEIGLREAAHQALLRDGYTDPSLHNYLQDAPFLGKQAAKVFGDIAILARGQLYVTPAEFIFVQDSYRNDCDGCHNEYSDCQGIKCNRYKSHESTQLVALWTVKRIRHRDENYGHRYEIEYTISPVDTAASNGHQVAEGKFNYGLPGYVFVIRSNPRYTSGYQHNKFFSSPDQVKWHRNHLSRLPDEQHHNHLITHTYPPRITNIYQTPGTSIQYETTASTADPREIHLYRNLIKSLAAKTSTTGHRFKIEPQSTSSSIDRMTAAIPPPKTKYQITSSSFAPRTTLVQLHTGQIVPLTEISTSTIPQGQLQILTPVELAPIQTFTTNGFHLIPTQPITTPDNKQHSYTESTFPNQIPSTSVPIFIMKEVIPPSVRPEVVKTMGSTKLPKKTTIHFFAAEDDEQSSQEDIKSDIFKTTTKYATEKKFSEIPSRKTNDEDYDEDDFDLFQPSKSTEPMRKVTEVPFKETSPSVNQVPRPNKETPTTRPYSSSTIPTIEELHSTFGRRTTIPVKNITSTRIPTTYATESTKITLPIPRIDEYETTKKNKIFRKPTVFTKTTMYQETTSLPTLQTTTQSTTLQNFKVGSTTAEPRETIVTVTPIQTISTGYNEATLTSLGYNTIVNTEHTTEQKESQLYPTMSKTTFTYPNTGLSTTFAPRTISTTLEENTNRKVTTTPEYNSYTEYFPTETKFGTSLTGTISTDANRQTIFPFSTVFPFFETERTDSTFRLNKLTTPSLKSTIPTRLATTKLKPNKIKNNNNDFLVEDISEQDSYEPILKSTNKNKFQDYTDDDIFGPTTKQKPKKLSKYQQQKSKIYRTGFTTEPTRTVAKTPKIIYSDFYEASTVPPTTSLTQFRAESQNNFVTKPLDPTTEYFPLTSLSYLTSISYKVNKKNDATAPMDDIEILPTIRAKLENVVNNEKLQIFKAELPDTEENTTSKVSDKEAFDNIALQLVNHARSLDLLNKKKKEGKENPLEEKKATKYKRRNLYIPKSRRISGKEKANK
ncbi:hypothetical protein HHI36_011761 [Cryptolaemus montrouzieri]|uniref:Uncharacterized protein n=1 Tax=Cryptolaemus montrouzieri TaxID=559131 RepID=A0ABD2NCL7_9CUCU